MNGYDDRPSFLEGFQFWAGSLPTPVYVFLGLVGAVAGFVYGLSQPHHAQYFYGIVGGIAGVSVIPLIAMAIRLVIWLIIVGLIITAVYYAFVKP